MRLASPNKWERPSSKNMGFMFSNPKTHLHDTNIIITIITFNRWLIHKRYIKSLIFFLCSLQTRNKEKVGLVSLSLYGLRCLLVFFLCLRCVKVGKRRPWNCLSFASIICGNCLKRLFLTYLPNCHRSFSIFCIKITIYFTYSWEFQWRSHTLYRNLQKKSYSNFTEDFFTFS